MLYGSETWCLRENEVDILRTKKVMMKAMCGVKTIEKKRAKNFARFNKYFGWTGQSEWSAMVWACFEKG